VSYGFWKRAKPLSDSAFDRSFIMTLMNRERARLVKREIGAVKLFGKVEVIK